MVSLSDFWLGVLQEMEEYYSPRQWIENKLRGSVNLAGVAALNVGGSGAERRILLRIDGVTPHSRSAIIDT
jgi:hypothetical protein